MAVDYPFGFGDGTAPQFLALAAAATLPVVLLLSTMMPAAGAAEQLPIIAGNDSLCSGFDGDGGCLAIAIARAQPELEGFEMATDLASSGVVFRRSLQANGGTATGFSSDKIKYGCGKNKPGQPYYSCVPPARQGGPNPEKCDTLKRGNPCPS